MARRKRRTIDHGAKEIDVNSFSDIAFLLIIFFVLVTSFVETKGFQAEIPASQKSTTEQTEETTTVKVNNNQLFFGKDKIDIDQLHRRLEKLKLAERETENERIVVLELDGRVEYQLFYDTMAAISHNGGIVAIQKEEK